VYRAVWTPVVDSILEVRREVNNEFDSNAVAVLNDSNIVGHTPREISSILANFLKHGGDLKIKILNNRQLVDIFSWKC